MKLILFDRNIQLAVAWRQSFEGQADVQVTTQDFRTIECDAIVSPANSFGFMDGGIDLALSEYFGWDVQDQLQTEIRRRPMRELLVGEALIEKAWCPATGRSCRDRRRASALQGDYSCGRYRSSMDCH